MEVSVYGKKVIKRDIYQIIIPMILENILQISANLVITAMVGRLLANDISAQGICIRITDTLWCFYKGVAIGGYGFDRPGIRCGQTSGLQEDCGADHSYGNDYCVYFSGGVIL
ncbi:hypothetical protein DWX98_10695 [Blautia sp. AF22-5LB]|nr:hypothetical protein DWX98_10695 [Blautia sp. AF22-5LB]